MLTLEEIIGLIFAAMFIVLVVVAGKSIAEFYSKSPDKETKSALERIAEEVKDLKDDEKLNVRVSMNANFEIRAFTNDHPAICKGDDCVCVFHVKKEEPSLCQTVDKFKDDKEINLQVTDGQVIAKETGPSFDVPIARHGNFVSFITFK